MKKLGIVVIGLIIIGCYSCGSERNNDKKENDLREYELVGNVKYELIGNVKKVTIEEYEADRFGKIIKKGISNITYSVSFNKDGRKIVIEEYLIPCVKFFKYDDKNNLIEKYVKSEETSKDVLIDRRKYDDKNNCIESIIYNINGDIAGKWIFKYDEKDRLIEESWYSEESLFLESGSLSHKWIYKYDGKGNKIEDNLYNSDGYLCDKHIYKYDEKGNNTEYFWYDSDGKLLEKTIYKYDKKGNNTESYSYDSEGILYVKEQSKYNNKNLKTVYKYYVKGYEVIEFIHQYEYQYDKKGNWIKMIVYENKVPKTITYRTIEYY